MAARITWAVIVLAAWSIPVAAWLVAERSGRA